MKDIEPVLRVDMKEYIFERRRDSSVIFHNQLYLLLFGSGIAFVFYCTV